MINRYVAKSNVVWGDVDLSEYDAFAISCNIFDRPDRDVDVVSVPGKNGDLIFDNGRYKNIDRIYQIQVMGVQNAMDLVSKLTNQIGYHRLQDEYEDDVYMEARITSQPVIDRFVGDAVRITLVLDRKPQKFLLQGEETYTKTSAMEVTNNSNNGRYGVVEFSIENVGDFPSRPTIYIPGYNGYNTTNVTEWDLCNVWVVHSDERINLQSTMSPDAGLPFSVIDEKVRLSCMHTLNTRRAGTAGRRIDIDCENRTYSFDTTPNYDETGRVKNRFRVNYAEGAAWDFPVLKPGMNYIYLMYWGQTYAYRQTNVTQANPTITARWWRL